MGKIVSIANQKGGVGKTTTAINLSACLSALNKKSLLVDMDPQSNATSGLGVDKKGIKYSIYDCIIREVPLSQAIISSAYNNLDIVPSNSDLTGAEVELTALLAREYRLKNGLIGIAEKYDFIIVDCPPSLGLLTINSLTASNAIIIPLQCEYYALEGLSQLLHTVELVKKSLNSGLEIEGILLTMCDQRTNLSNQVIEDVKGYFKDKVYNIVIPRAVKLSEAPGFGKPIIYYEEKSIGAERYAMFAKEFLEKNKIKQPTEGICDSAPAELNKRMDISGDEDTKEEVAV